MVLEAAILFTIHKAPPTVNRCSSEAAVIRWGKSCQNDKIQQQKTCCLLSTYQRNYAPQHRSCESVATPHKRWIHIILTLSLLPRCANQKFEVSLSDGHFSLAPDLVRIWVRVRECRCSRLWYCHLPRVTSVSQQATRWGGKCLQTDPTFSISFDLFWCCSWLLTAFQDTEIVYLTRWSGDRAKIQWMPTWQAKVCGGNQQPKMDHVYFVPSLSRWVTEHMNSKMLFTLCFNLDLLNLFIGGIV